MSEEEKIVLECTRYGILRKKEVSREKMLNDFSSMEKYDDLKTFSKIKSAINRRNFGFVFSSENAQIDGNEIKQIAVYKARNLLNNNGDFEPIYKTLVSTYIERLLRFYSNDFKADNIVKFFSSNPNSIKSKWIANKEFVNAVIQDGDDINYEIDNESGICNINIAFNGNIKNLEVEITRTEVAN